MSELNLEENSNEIEELKAELVLAQKKVEEHLDGWKRAKADYLNYKKDTEKYQAEMIQYANAALIAQLLPIYDNFKLAWQHVPAEQQKSDWVTGFGHIKNQFSDFLKNLGIQEIKTVGEKFNPEIHEAVASEEKDGYDADVVFEEVKSGYSLHEKVIYPAKVKVTK
ncbi:MAG: nucleotide exchange factor GrpE [Candidatus Buchananbacteria bacterium]